MLSTVLGIGLGLVQGYLSYPTLLWARILVDHALLPWKESSLTISKDICLVIILVFLAIIHFVIIVSIQSMIASPVSFGKTWTLGLFFGLCLYVILPIIEQRGVKKQHD